MTASSASSEDGFVETGEYRRFCEFCDACRRFRYIGLCYGPPGVGKTLSARRYADWDKVESCSPYNAVPEEFLEQAKKWNTVFFTPTIINSPWHIQNGIQKVRGHLQELLREPLRREETACLAQVLNEEKTRQESMWDRDWFFEKPLPPIEPSFSDVVLNYVAKRKAIKDPTSLILIDEADRLKLTSLEQTRDIFDQGDIGLILIGMPGMEKRLSRYAQLYSRIGFVHAFRPLCAEELRQLLAKGWTPSQVNLPESSITDSDALAAILRITGGNFRLLDRLLAQIARLLEINQLESVNGAVVEAARESLVIGPA